MTFSILIVFISLIALITLHELGHFAFAKKFGVKVEEFGIGYPPRIFGKKFGDTVYSINILPFGAFVRLEGEEDGKLGPSSFGSKPIWQRALILFGGVASFWLVSIILFSIIMSLGVAMIVDDSFEKDLIDPSVEIVSVSPGSPADIAGIEIGDIIRGFEYNNYETKIDKVKQVQELSEKYKGKAVVLIIQRGKEIIKSDLNIRNLSPDGEGNIGVGLVRTSITKYPWYQSILKGIEATWNTTVLIIKTFGIMIANLFKGQGVPPGVQVVGPIGVFGLMVNAANFGLIYFLQFIAIISVYLAVFNFLPIPALDGGKLLFLLIEKIKGSPVNQKIEQKITLASFLLLISLMVFVTIKDIIRIF